MVSVHRSQADGQLGLFDKERGLPRWESFPARVRQEVVRLLEKILVEHGCRTLKELAERKEPADE